MRRPDLRGEYRPLDGQDPLGTAPGRLAELRQRLERLPPGHPSSPERDRGHEARDRAGELEGTADPDAGGDLKAGNDLEADGDLDGEEERDRPGRAGEEGGPAGDGQLASGLDLSQIREHEPYRPWFTDGGPAQPWFAGESG
jgi:hypothetical protein